MTLPSDRGLLLASLIPAGDREAVVGDLVEECAFRGLTGARRTWWLSGECAAIAMGLMIQRLRNRVAVPPLREVLAGVLVDASLSCRDRPGRVVARGVAICATVGALALGVEVLVATLLSAAGLR